MRLDVSVLRLLSKDDFRVLRAVELGMRNHEIVPVPLIMSIAKLRQSIATRSIKELLKHKLLHHENVQYDGYRLTTTGYDFLAIHTLTCRGRIHGFGRRIGTGKESDVYEVLNEEGAVMIMKLHRLGRTSFRAVKNKRDYLRHRKNFNWLYISRLAALGEYAFMEALRKRGFPVPEPIDQNRHVVLMSVVDGFPLSQVKKMQNPGKVFQEIMQWFVKFVHVGLVHCDFNEFNVMINDEEEITIIDFPQMVSVWHRNAEELYNRDRECMINFFARRFDYHPDDDDQLNSLCPEFLALMGDQSNYLDSHSDRIESLDWELRASGFKESRRQNLISHLQGEETEADFVSDASTDDEHDDDLIPTTDEPPEKTEVPPETKRRPPRRKNKVIAQTVTSEQRKMMSKDTRSRLRKNTNKGNAAKKQSVFDI